MATPTPKTTRLAKFYEMNTGTLAGGFWNERASRRGNPACRLLVGTLGPGLAYNSFFDWG